MREDGPVRWNGAAREKYKGSLTGPIVVPGTYTVEMDIAGRRFAQRVEVKPDPRASLTQADYLAGYRIARATLEKYSKVDAALERLDAMIALEQKAGPAGADVLARAQTLRGDLTADYHNDEDSIGRPGKLREDLEDQGFTGGSPPSVAQVAHAARVSTEYNALMSEVTAFFGSQPPVTVPPAPPLDCSTADD